MRDGDVIPAEEGVNLDNEGLKGERDSEFRAESGGDARLRENVVAQGAESGGDERLRDDVVAQEEMETRKQRIKRRLGMPTKADIDEHYPLHLQYRSCCAHCVAGRGTSDRHMTGDNN